MAVLGYKYTDVSRVGDVWLVVFKENAFTPDFIAELHTILDQVERAEGPSAVVFASSAKVFSGGMNINWILGQISEGNKSAGVELFCLCMKLFGRLLTFPVPTVAAIRRHCYAGGLMFACACDHRIMSTSGASVCMSEITYNLPLPQGGVEVLKAKLHPAILKDLLLTGRKVSSKEAYESRIVDSLCDESVVQTKGLEFAQSLAEIGTKRTAYRLIKLQMYGTAAEVCHKAQFTYEEMKAGAGGFAKL